VHLHPHTRLNLNAKLRGAFHTVRKTDANVSSNHNRSTLGAFTGSSDSRDQHSRRNNFEILSDCASLLHLAENPFSWDLQIDQYEIEHVLDDLPLPIEIRQMHAAAAVGVVADEHITFAYLTQIPAPSDLIDDADQ
jgi:hypothetical protein